MIRQIGVISSVILLDAGMAGLVMPRSCQEDEVTSASRRFSAASSRRRADEGPDVAGRVAYDVRHRDARDPDQMTLDITHPDEASVITMTVGQLEPGAPNGGRDWRLRPY